MASELTREVYEVPENFPFMKSLLPLPCDVQGPGEKRRLASPLQSLLQHTLSKEEKKGRHGESAGRHHAAGEKATGPATLEDLVLGQETMKENNYPVEGSPEVAEYVVIGDTLKNAATVLAVDCEMVRTDNGLDLARISVVNDRMEVVYDTFVVPDLEIRDYNTRFSGITSEMLQGVTTSLRDVQAHLLSLVSTTTVLVGHSLENDLHTLKMIHTNVADTALLYSHQRGPPYKPSLKWLSEKFLAKDIQGNESGHDTIEDARCAMELVALKMKHGVDYGTINNDSIRLSVKLEQNGRTSAIVDTKSITGSLGLPPAAHKVCASDLEVVEGVREFAHTKHFVFGRLTGLEAYHRNEEQEHPSDKSHKQILDEMDSRIREIHEGLPHNAMFIVLSGQGNVALARKLMARKDDCKKSGETDKAEDTAAGGDEDLGAPVVETDSSAAPQDDSSKNVWSRQDELRLEESIKIGRQGLGFFCVKTVQK